MPINNPSGSGGAWTLLHDETLAADGNFDISGISQVHNHLYITILTRADVAATSDALEIILNGDETATNYANATHTGGDFHLSTAADTNAAFLISADSSPANYFTVWGMSIQFYNVAQNKDIYATD